MTRALVRAADITRAVKALENAGWPRGSFKVIVEGSAITLLPIDAAADEDAELARRMEEVFGGDERATPLR
jgi:hypothetical protein